MKTLVSLLIAFMVFFVCSGQSIKNYSQQMATPTQNFPALAGWHGSLHTNLQARNQYSGLPVSYVTLNANIDGFIDTIRSVFSLNLAHDRLNTGWVLNESLEMIWTPKLVLRNELVLMPALSFKSSQTAIDWTRFNLNTYPQFNKPTLVPQRESVRYNAFGAGFGIIYKETFFASHIHDINQPNISFYDSDEHLVLRTYSFLLGHVFTFDDYKITPSLSYHNQGNLNLVSLACNAQYKWIYVGAKYDFNGLAGVALGGEIMQRFRFSYSYDITTSRLGNQTLGSHELAMRIWLFKDKVKRQFLSNLPLM